MKRFIFCIACILSFLFLLPSKVNPVHAACSGGDGWNKCSSGFAYECIGKKWIPVETCSSCGCSGNFCAPAPYCSHSCGCTTPSCTGGNGWNPYSLTGCACGSTTGCYPSCNSCCGGSGQACCSGNTCNAGLHCYIADNVCLPNPYCTSSNNTNCYCGCVADPYGGHCDVCYDGGCPCGGVADVNGGSCYTCTPTNTPVPTDTPIPTPPIAAGTGCAIGQANDSICSTDRTNSLTCLPSFIPGVYNWTVSQTCLWGLCDLTTNKCPPDPSSLFCTKTLGCYSDSKCNNKITSIPPNPPPFYQKFNCYTAPPPDGTLIPPANICGYTGTLCEVGCSGISETCGGNAVCTPPLVSHVDNCNRVSCKPPCVPSAPGCTPDCSNAPNVCFGVSFSDGCSGTCEGIKACSGTLTARAATVTAATANCASIPASTNYLTGTTISFVPAVSPVSQTQAGGILSWPTVTTDGTSVYTVQSEPPPQYALGTVCVSENGAAWTQNASGTLTDAGTLDYAIGYISQAGWVQSTVGNVYTAGQLTASIPATATNPYFSLVGTGGTAGIVSYGTDYDFSLSASNLGETQVSPNNWLVNQTYTPVDYYERFEYTLRNATKTAITSGLDSLTKPACATSPCVFTIEGNMTTAPSLPWTIGANEQIILLVNGNVTISSNITIASGGFFALLVHGNITIDPAVTTLDGMFIATNNTHAAVFSTGVGASQFVVHGSVIADSFSLLRDLGAANSTTPAEVFAFDPHLLFTMPDIMKETPYVWQEV